LAGGWGGGFETRGGELGRGKDKEGHKENVKERKERRKYKGNNENDWNNKGQINWEEEKVGKK
jgi:hypothetical protein